MKPLVGLELSNEWGNTALLLSEGRDVTHLCAKSKEGLT
jgi:hypothetical protein